MANKATLIAQLLTYFPDNGVKAITPEILRDYFELFLTNAMTLDDNFSNDTAEVSGLTTKAWSIQAVKDYVAGVGGVSTGISVQYTFDTTTTAGTGSGEMRLNNASPASTTIIYFNDISSNGDASGIISSLDGASQIVFQDPTDIDTYQVFDVTGTPTDLSGEWSVPVIHASGGATTITDAQSVNVLFGLGSQGFNHLLTEDLNADGNTIINLPAATSNGEAVRYDEFAALEALLLILRNGVTTLSVSSNTITWDLSTDAPFAEVELDANVTTFTISNQYEGTEITLLVKQDATGSRTLVAPTGYTATGAGFTIYSNGNSYTLCKFYKGDAYDLCSTNYDADTGGGGVAVGGYAAWSNLLLDQASQESGGIYRATDASGHPSIATNSVAYFEYRGTTNGDETDYYIIAALEDRTRITTLEGQMSLKPDNLQEVLDGGKTASIGFDNIDITTFSGTLRIGGGLPSIGNTSGGGINFQFLEPVLANIDTEQLYLSNQDPIVTAGFVNSIHHYGAQAFSMGLASGTADSDPGTGLFKPNNSSPTSTTFLYFDNDNILGDSITGILSHLGAGDKIGCGIRSSLGTGEKYGVFTVTGSPVAATGYYKIPVTNDWWTGTASYAGGILQFGIHMALTDPSAGIEEAPNDGSYYARRNEDWEEIIPSGSPNAEDVIYDNAESGLTATNDQDAIDEIVASGALNFGMLPKNYDFTATNIFIDPSYGGTEAGTISQPYTGITEAEAALEATTGSQHVHVYIKSGESVEPFNITNGRGISRLQRNRIATYGGPAPAIIGQAAKARPTFTQVGATNVWTTPDTDIVGFYAANQRFKRSTDGVVHTITASTGTTLTAATFSTYGDLVGCEVDVQVTPYDCRTLRIVSRSGTTITVDASEGGTLALLGGSITHTCKIYGIRSELDGGTQWASENVSGDGLVAVYSTVNPNSNPDLFIPLNDESSFELGSVVTEFNAYWEFDNISFQYNGRDGVEVFGDYSYHKYTNCSFLYTMRCGASHFGSYTGLGNQGMVMDNCTFVDYGAQGIIHWRAYKGKFTNLVFDFGYDHDDGEFYGFRHQVTGSNGVTVFGSAIACIQYRDVGSGDPLDDARSENIYSDIYVFGTYENGMLIGGYGNRLKDIRIKNHSTFTTDTAGVYFGGDFTHANSLENVYVDGERTVDANFDLIDQYVSTSGAVHGFYTDFYSYNNHHRNCVAVNHTRGAGVFRNIAAHYNLYEECLLANNLYQYLRADVFGATVAPGEHSVFRRNTCVSMNRVQRHWRWETTGTNNDPFDDYQPGEWDSNIYIHVNDGGKFTPRLNGINTTRADEGFSFEAAKEVTGIDANSKAYGLWDRHIISDYSEVAEIVDSAATPDFTADSVGVTDNGTVTYNATDDCYEMTPDAVNVGDGDTTNTIILTNAYTDYNPAGAGEVLTWVFEFEADQDGMYIAIGVYNGTSYEESYRIDLKRGRHTYVLQHITEAAYSGAWFTLLTALKSSVEDDLVIRFHSCYIYRGTGTEFGPIVTKQNVFLDDALEVWQTSNLPDTIEVSTTERALDAGMMIPLNTAGVQLDLTNRADEAKSYGFSCRYDRNYTLLQSTLIRTGLLAYAGMRQVTHIFEMDTETDYTNLPDSVKETPGYIFLTPE